MTTERVTTPKPFIFVLMPFEKKFDDIYAFGIREAAEAAGAYAERLDEQIFTKSMLERIFNQINKADVIVADMTARNPNVFYEVGYAHALGKTVILLTQDSDDIPFDLKHRQHTVYQGSIKDLRESLEPKLRWAIERSREQSSTSMSTSLSISIDDKPLPDVPSAEAPPIIEATPPGGRHSVVRLSIAVVNYSSETTTASSSLFLFTRPGCVYMPIVLEEYKVRRKPSPEERPYRLGFGYETETETINKRPRKLPCSVVTSASAVGDLSICYKLPGALAPLPPGGLDFLELYFNETEKSDAAERYRLRIQFPREFKEVEFGLRFVERDKEDITGRAGATES